MFISLRLHGWFLCADINECEPDNPCEGNCTNTIGSFECSCDEGYTSDSLLCIGKALIRYAKKICVCFTLTSLACAAQPAGSMFTLQFLCVCVSLCLPYCKCA